MSDTGMNLITNRIMELEREFFGDEGFEDAEFDELEETEEEDDTEETELRHNDKTSSRAKTNSKHPTKKSKICKACGTEDPDLFYPYATNMCKKCWAAREANRRRKARSAKAESHSYLSTHRQTTIEKIPQMSRAPTQPAYHQKQSKTIKERCALEIQAAGSDGIFQRDLRGKLKIDKQACRHAVKELIDSGVIAHTGEMSETGSPKLIWKKSD